MSASNHVSEIGESKIIHECIKKGYKIAIPLGHDWRYDLIVERNGKLERVQVKTVNSDGQIIKLKNCSMGKYKNGKKQLVTYDDDAFDWFAVYDITTDSCYYIPKSRVNTVGAFHLRLCQPKNNMKKGINWATEFIEW